MKKISKIHFFKNTITDFFFYFYQVLILISYALKSTLDFVIPFFPFLASRNTVHKQKPIQSLIFGPRQKFYLKWSKLFLNSFQMRTMVLVVSESSNIILFKILERTYCVWVLSRPSGTAKEDKLVDRENLQQCFSY